MIGDGSRVARTVPDGFPSHSQSNLRDTPRVTMPTYSSATWALCGRGPCRTCVLTRRLLPGASIVASRREVTTLTQDLREFGRGPSRGKLWMAMGRIGRQGKCRASPVLGLPSANSSPGSPWVITCRLDTSAYPDTGCRKPRTLVPLTTIRYPKSSTSGPTISCDLSPRWPSRRVVARRTSRHPSQGGPSHTSGVVAAPRPSPSSTRCSHCLRLAGVEVQAGDGGRAGHAPPAASLQHLPRPS